MTSNPTQIGSTISHYRILGLLGMGGMGTVYRARDERLDRDVALKVLLPATADDVTAKARLLREARMASSLNHPHIAHVYEVGEDHEHLFIAMEMVEGRTLRDSSPPGGFPPETLLRLGASEAPEPFLALESVFPPRLARDPAFRQAVTAGFSTLARPNPRALLAR